MYLFITQTMILQQNVEIVYFIMELLTYIENKSSLPIPVFKHAIKIIGGEGIQNDPTPCYSQKVSIPDKLILNQNNDLREQSQDNISCYLLFGYQLEIKDWHEIAKLYPQYSVVVRLYQGKHVTTVSDSILNAKSFAKGQRRIIEPRRTLIKVDEKPSQSCVHMYVVQLNHKDSTQSTKLIYYLPSVFNFQASDYLLQCIKARYFNNKVLQILSEYVSLQNNCTSCFKDMFHHDFQSVIYTGRVTSFKTFIKLTNQTSDLQVSGSFIEKLSQISLTDKHLLDQIDPLDFSDIKKEIRNLILQQKRIRKSLSYEKIQIVQQIQNALQFLNLKQIYPNKLTFNAINSQMLKKIKSQNIDNKAIWIKQQNFVMNNLDARLIDLQRAKAKLSQTLMLQQKRNNEQIQQIRKQIKQMQTNIRFKQAQKANKTFNDGLHMKNSAVTISKSNSINRQKTGNKEKTMKAHNRSLSLQQLQRQRLLKYEMIKAQFEIQKQFARRKAEYARAAEQMFNYLIDC